MLAAGRREAHRSAEKRRMRRRRRLPSGGIALYAVVVAIFQCGAAIASTCSTGDAAAADTSGPDHVSITWMSVTNVYYEIGRFHLLIDGYITRIPKEAFYGGGGYAFTRHPHATDVAAVKRVLTALGGPRSVDLLLTGHSHWDHSFDTATWSKLTGAPVLGAKTTC